MVTAENAPTKLSWNARALKYGELFDRKSSTRDNIAYREAILSMLVLGIGLPPFLKPGYLSPQEAKAVDKKVHPCVPRLPVSLPSLY